MAQQRGGKRLASQEKQRVRRGNPFILPAILGVIVLVLLLLRQRLDERGTAAGEEETTGRRMVRTLRRFSCTALPPSFF